MASIFSLKARRILVILAMLFVSSNARAQTANNAVSLSGADFFRTTLWSPQLFGSDNRNFTFEFWFNATSPGVLVGESDTANVVFWDVAFAEVFAGGVVKAGAPDVPTITVGTITFGSWNHLTVVYNEPTRTLSAYLNGTLGGSSTGLRKIPKDNSREAVYPFGRGGPLNLGGGNWFTGKFDEVRIWNIAVDSAYVAANWNRFLATDPAGLMAVWHFDATSGSLSPDARAGGNNPSLYVPVEATTPLVASTAPILTPAPTIITKPAVVTDFSAVLNATANSRGNSSAVSFEWGPTTAYGNTTAAKDIGNGSSDVNVSETLSNLAPGTYHFRALITASALTTRGQDQTFTILGPSATTGAATVTGRSAVLNGTANARGLSSSVLFEWGASTDYGNSTPSKDIGSSSTSIAFSETLSDLSAGIYHYRAVITYAGGRANGLDRTFTVLPPTANTLAPVLSPGVVELKGRANPQGVSASGYFAWGTTTAYGNTTPLQALGSGGADVNFSETLANLPPGEYHYAAILTNATQEIRGSDQSFTLLGFSGKAARLNGTDYLRTTTWSDTIFDDEDFTIELWFNASSPGALINEPDTADVGLWDYNFAEIFAGGIIKAGVPDVPTFTVGTITFNTWHHLALVYDGSKKLLSAYLDGQPSGTSAGDRKTPREITRTSIYCFGRGGATNLGGGNFLSGLIDEVRIWRRPLSAQEIASQFDKVLVSTEPALMGNWHLDEVIAGSSHLSPDASGKNNSAWHAPSGAMTLVLSTTPVIPDTRPMIVSNSARAISPFVVELQGSVNAQGTNTIVFFEYSRDNVVQRTSPLDIGFGNVPIRFTELVSIAELGATYQYRLYASNAFGIVASAEGSFVATSWAGHSYVLAPNDYLRTTNSQNARFPDKNITVELWFYPTKAGVLASETVFSPNYDRSLIEVLPSGNVQAGFNGLTPISLGDANLSQWNHVALRYNAGALRMDGFLNGVKGGSRSGIRNAPAQSGLQGQFAFGRSTQTKLGTGEYFGGELDEIRVWNIARTDEDLTSARFNLLAGDEPGLVFNWRGNPLATDPISDNSPNNNNGQNVGANVNLSTAPLTFSARRNGPNEIETQFVIKGGSLYRLESSPNLTNWTPVSTNTAPTSGYVRLPQALPTQAGALFFRTKPLP